MTEAVSSNAQVFARTLQGWADDMPEQFSVVVRKLSLELLGIVVRLTRVDTGRARGNWQLTISFPTEAQIERLDKQGQATINAGLLRLAELKGTRFGGVIFITNNVDYIIELDDRDNIVETAFELLSGVFR